MNSNFHRARSLFPELTEADLKKVDEALLLVDQAEQQLSVASIRPQGIDVASVLMTVHMDLESVLAALLSDSRLEGFVSLIDIERQFGPLVAALVKDVKWLNKASIYTPEMASEPDQSEILRRMLLAMTDDVRAVLIKLAYRIQRLRNLKQEAPHIQRFIAQETLDIFAPLANRLGISQFKWELEDLAFRYLEPEQYRRIAEALAENRKQRETCINQFIEQLKTVLEQQQIKGKVYGRPKHIYSIWCKMRRKQLPVADLYDLLAVRVIVEDVAACYTVLGLAHAEWQYIPKEFDDYIANPKENNYQSLHTVVLDPQGNRIEIQIRTSAMHEFAELGVAAHWRYKEGSRFNAATAKNIASLRQLLEDRSHDNLLESFHTELFSDRVYVLTPAGKLIDLVKGATALDFAYAIHTDVGHSCRGAKVNGQIKPLTYPLQSGEQVEIITVKNGQPSRNWLDQNLGYLKTPRAISKVKNWFKQHEFSDNVAAGKSLFDKEIKRLGLKTYDLADLLKHFKMPDAEHLYQAIGRGDINNRQLASAFKIPELAPTTVKLAPLKTSSKSDVTVADMDNLATTLAHCCSPVHGDDIVGFISHRRGITIHRRDCDNIRQMSAEQQAHLLKADWSGSVKAQHNVPIVVEALSGGSLLIEVSQMLHHAKIPITDVSMKTRPDLSVTLTMQIQIDSTAQLSAVLSKISQLPNVLEVKRKV